MSHSKLVSDSCIFWFATSANGNTVYVATARPYDEGSVGDILAKFFYHDIFTKEQLQCPDKPGYYMLEGEFTLEYPEYDIDKERFNVIVQDPVWHPAVMDCV